MKNTLLAILMAGLVISFNSCANKGCTDTAATNFEEDAEKDNGSCTYECQVVVYGGNANMQEVSVEIDDKPVGSYSAFSSNGAYVPACGEEGFLTYTVDMGKSKELSVKFRGVPKSGTAFQKRYDLEAGKCNPVKLTF